jgi:hypothetical protein
MLEKPKVLEIEPNTTYRKYMESAHMSLIVHPISEHSPDISPTRTSTNGEISRLHLRPV